MDMPIHSVIAAGRVEGTDVYNPDGQKLGTIDDLMIDRVSGQVQYAVMEFGGFLGIGTDRYPIPWRLLTYDTGLEGYVVPLSTPQLEALRPGPVTPVAGLFLAGDWTNTGLPATIEGAVRSGNAAAAVIHASSQP